MTAADHMMEVTAYCNCGKCCSWEHGVVVSPSHYLALALNTFPPVRVKRRRPNPYQDKAKQKTFVFDKYWTGTTLKGCVYEGKTANGEMPRQSRPGPLHPRSLRKPVRLALRLALAPWHLCGRTGTIAADLDLYPFGTRMHVPGYGWGVVADCGSAIKGPQRLDLYFNSHAEALQWGRRRLRVKVVRPNDEWIDKQRLVPPAVRSVVKGVDRVFHSIFGG